MTAYGFHWLPMYFGPPSNTVVAYVWKSLVCFVDMLGRSHLFLCRI